jgi:hypothetical protein
MIMHVATKADEEWFCEKRQDLIEVLVANYLAKTGKAIDIYGVNTGDLSVYLTTDRDLQRKQSRMPGQPYKLESRSSLYKSQVSGILGEEEWDEELFDDFVMIDKSDLEKYNEPDKLDKARNEKDSGPSVCLIGRPGLKNEKITLEDF